MCATSTILSYLGGGGTDITSNELQRLHSWWIVINGFSEHFPSFNGM